MSSALVLGGHSFIRQLGIDPEPDRREAERIVSACLDHGIAWFDTTYVPERVRLARALQDGGGRPEARIVVWNFFDDEHADGTFGGASEWTQERFDAIRRIFGRDRIDALMVHPIDDARADARQRDLAVGWLGQGLVGCLGLWEPDAVRLGHPPGPYTFFVRPCNPACFRDRPLFDLGARSGWQAWACSPFHRGWNLERACRSAAEPREVVARDLLRYARHAPGVARLIVSMRRSDLVAVNIAAEALGPLAEERIAGLERLLSAGG